MNARVLFVDDEAIILKSLRLLFRGKYEIYTATSGDEAIAIAESNSINVVVADQRMPGMTGVELLKKLKEISPSTVRILLTGYSDLQAIQSSVNESEVFRFINKPWDNYYLREIVDQAANLSVELNQPSQTIELHGGYPGFETNLKQAKPGEAESCMIIDNENGISEAMSDLYSGDMKILHARNLGEALKMLHLHNIVLIISETEIAGQDVSEFLHLLKHEHPSIMTIIISKTMDFLSIQHFINHVQIFRFLPKPIKKGLLRISIDSALKKRFELKSRPRTKELYTVDKLKKYKNPAHIIPLLIGVKNLLAR